MGPGSVGVSGCVCRTPALHFLELWCTLVYSGVLLCNLVYFGALWYTLQVLKKDDLNTENCFSHNTAVGEIIQLTLC